MATVVWLVREPLCGESGVGFVTRLAVRSRFLEAMTLVGDSVRRPCRHYPNARTIQKQSSPEINSFPV